MCSASSRFSTGTSLSRIARAIARMQGRGIAYADVDPHYAAHALGAMVDRFAYVTYVLGDAFEID